MCHACCIDGLCMLHRWLCMLHRCVWMLQFGPSFNTVNGPGVQLVTASLASKVIMNWSEPIKTAYFWHIYRMALGK